MNTVNFALIVNAYVTNQTTGEPYSSTCMSLLSDFMDSDSSGIVDAQFFCCYMNITF